MKLSLPLPFQNTDLRIGEVPERLPDVQSRGVLWQIARERFLISVPDTARYLVEGGERITVEPFEGGAEGEVNRFLLLTPLAALLFQRGTAVFHASVVAKAGRALIIAGESGVGKSFLAAVLAQRGWSFLGDDLAPVWLNERGEAEVFFTSSRAVLWPDAIESLGREVERTPGDGGGRVPLSFEGKETPLSLPVGAVLFLSAHNGEDLLWKRERGLDIFRKLSLHLYNTHVADALLSREAFLNVSSVLSQRVPHGKLVRPRKEWNVEELVLKAEEVLE